MCAKYLDMKRYHQKKLWFKASIISSNLNELCVNVTVLR